MAIYIFIPYDGLIIFFPHVIFAYKYAGFYTLVQSVEVWYIDIYLISKLYIEYSCILDICQDCTDISQV